MKKEVSKLLGAFLIAALAALPAKGMAGTLPDLQVTNVYLKQHAYGDKCRIMITARNNGGAVPPQQFDQSSVALLEGAGQVHVRGGYSLRAVDPGRKLSKPGGVLTFPWNAILLEPGVYYFGAKMDSNNKIAEGNEGNNEMRPVRLECVGETKPDLVVQNIRLVQGCKIEVTIANIGSGAVPDAGYDIHNGAVIQMYRGNRPWGGIRLGAVDSQKKLARPGGRLSFLWFPNVSNLALTPGPNAIKLVIDANQAVEESNEGNNSLSRNLYCGRSLPGRNVPLQKIPVKPNTVMPNDKVKGGSLLPPSAR